MMSSSTNEALDLTLQNTGSRRASPLVRQISMPDTTHISVTQFGCRPLKIKERFALRYSMRSSSMDSSLHADAHDPHHHQHRHQQQQQHGDGDGAAKTMQRSPGSDSELQPLITTTNTQPRHDKILTHSRSSGMGLSRSASATPSSRSPGKPPLIRYYHSLPEVDSTRQLLSVREEPEVREMTPQALKGKRKILLLPSLSADETGLPSPTKKPSPGASPNQTSGGTFFQCGPLDLSNLRKVPPISHIEEEEAEQRKVYLQQLQQLKDNIPNNPLCWRREDVHSWLAYMRLSHGLPQIRYERFLMNGKALGLMSQQMFLERVPCGGQLLYRDFQRRLSQAAPPDQENIGGIQRASGFTPPLPERTERSTSPQEPDEPMNTENFLCAGSKTWPKTIDSSALERRAVGIGRSELHAKLVAASQLNRAPKHATPMTPLSIKHSALEGRMIINYPQHAPNVSTASVLSSFVSDPDFRPTPSQRDAVAPLKDTPCFRGKLYCHTTGSIPSISSMPGVQSIPSPIGLCQSISASAMPIFSHTTCSFLASPVLIEPTPAKAVSCNTRNNTFPPRGVCSSEVPVDRTRSSPKAKQEMASAQPTSTVSLPDTTRNNDVSHKLDTSRLRVSPKTLVIDIPDSAIVDAQIIGSSADESKSRKVSHAAIDSSPSNMD